MMIYRIGWREALQVIFYQVDRGFILIAIGIPVIVSLILIYKLGNEAIAPIFIVVAIMLYTILSSIGYGWKLDDNKLNINVCSFSKKIAINSIEAQIVNSISEWRPTFRTGGSDAPGLSTGQFKLRNGKDAIVFRHLNDAKALVLLANDQYYIISHPGIEDLFNQILHLGAKRTVL